MRLGVAAAAWFVSLAATTPAWAQINAETLRRELRDRTASMKLDGELIGRLGNNQGVSLGFGLFSGFHVGPHLAFVRATADYARFNGATTVSRAFFHDRYNLHLFGPWTGELFGQVQQDRFQRLALRSLLGLGPRFAIYDTARLASFVGVSYMLEREAVVVAPGAPDKALDSAQRFSSYASIQGKLGLGTTFDLVLYAQPKVREFADFRLLLEASFVQKVTDTLSTKILITGRHDSRPPTAVKRTDLEVRNVLEFLAF